MTNAQFRKWRRSEFPSRAACATALEWDRETVKSIETGKTRGGAPFPVRRHHALAACAWTLRIRSYRGELESEIVFPQPRDE